MPTLYNINELATLMYGYMLLCLQSLIRITPNGRAHDYFSNQVWWSRITIGHAKYTLPGVNN